MTCNSKRKHLVSTRPWFMSEGLETNWKRKLQSSHPAAPSFKAEEPSPQTPITQSRQPQPPIRWVGCQYTRSELWGCLSRDPSTEKHIILAIVTTGSSEHRDTNMHIRSCTNRHEPKCESVEQPGRQHYRLHRVGLNVKGFETVAARKLSHGTTFHECCMCKYGSICKHWASAQLNYCKFGATKSLCFKFDNLSNLPSQSFVTN
jgi:hypothetical protein